MSLSYLSQLKTIAYREYTAVSYEHILQITLTALSVLILSQLILTYSHNLISKINFNILTRHIMVSLGTFFSEVFHLIFSASLISYTSFTYPYHLISLALITIIILCKWYKF